MKYPWRYRISVSDASPAELSYLLDQLKCIDAQVLLHPDSGGAPQQRPGRRVEIVLNLESPAARIEVAQFIAKFVKAHQGAQLKILGPKTEVRVHSKASTQSIVGRLVDFFDVQMPERERDRKEPPTQEMLPSGAEQGKLEVGSAKNLSVKVSRIVVRVFYATDRKVSPGRYWNERSKTDHLSFGTCEVSIPRDHRMGILESPSIWRFEFNEDPEKHIALLSVNQLDPWPWRDKLIGAVEGSREKQVFVFVHGYDTGFADAVRRTAQIAYDLGFDGAPICYSWPSQGEVECYPQDETNAEWTVPHLKQFLRGLSATNSIRTINVIAHSMGNRPVARALQLLAAEGQAICRVRHLVLAAPDIDADTFKDLAGAIKSVSDYVTIYSSPKDMALRVSKKFHGYPRLGEAPLIFPGIYAIDASAVDTSLIGHSYYAENRSILSDIFWLLKESKPPGDRFGIKIVQDSLGVYYAFRP